MYLSEDSLSPKTLEQSAGGHLGHAFGNGGGLLVNVACNILTYLVLNAGFVQIVPADGACVSANGPGPHGYCIPLLDLEALP
jgi:hypothetical protein